MSAELSQGSHFFHNLLSFAVLYFSVPPSASPGGRLGVAREPAARDAEPSTCATCAREAPLVLGWTAARAAA